jgi:hypothetical protein
VLLLRGDSAFYTGAVVSAARRAHARFSITVSMNPAVRRAIERIDGAAWIPIRYPNAVFDDDAGAWISEAEVAQTTYTAFAGWMFAPPRRAYGACMGSTEDPGADLGVDEGDVGVLLKQLGERTPDLPDELTAFLRRLLNPHGERTAPSGLYWPGADPEPPRVYGLGGPDPTASDGGR